MARFFDALTGEMRTLAWPGRERMATPRQVEVKVREGDDWGCAMPSDGPPPVADTADTPKATRVTRRLPTIPRSRVGWVNAQKGRPVEGVAIRVYFSPTSPAADIVGFRSLYEDGEFSVHCANDGMADNWWRYEEPTTEMPAKPLHWYDSLVPGRTYRIKVTKLEGYSMHTAPPLQREKLLGNTFDAVFGNDAFDVLGWCIHPNDVQLID